MIMLNSVSIDLGRKTILNNIDLELDNNTYGLLGPNGAGKTTLFRCICGLYTSYKGQIHADWGGIKSCDIGYLPQNFNLFDDLHSAEPGGLRCVSERTLCGT